VFLINSIKMSIRVFEKKEWRKHIDTCFEVQKKLKSCVNANQNFLSLDKERQQVISSATGKGFIADYLTNFASNNQSFAQAYKANFESSSPYWENHKEQLMNINDECNLMSLHECCENTYNLENLQGNYENAYRLLNKK